MLRATRIPQEPGPLQRVVGDEDSRSEAKPPKLTSRFRHDDVSDRELKVADRHGVTHLHTELGQQLATD